MPGPPRGPATTSEPPSGSDVPWLRLSGRMIWVDLAQTALSLTPVALAVWVFRVSPGAGALWPVIGVAVFGVLGAVADVLRWIFTRYRVTDTYLERRTGIVVRRYRSVRRDRIRSVDTDARLRHRVSGLRVVKVGAGQQATSGESALSLDAITRQDAAGLRALLLRRGGPHGQRNGLEAQGAVRGRAPLEPASPAHAPAEQVSPERAPTQDVSPQHATTPDAAPEQREPHGAPGRDAADDHAEVFAHLRLGWVVYNMVAWWGYLMAIGLLWGAYWLASTFGVDLGDLVLGAADWEALGWARTAAIAVLAVGLVGVVGLTVNFFTAHWRFELARVPGEDGTVLRTTQGLLRTREVSRADSRVRGLMISEPVLWRWMGMADTELITTGLSIWTGSSTILPRGPVSVARPVAARVLEVDPSPFDTPLRSHPRRALRRRLWWASTASLGVAGTLWWLARTDVVPYAALWSLAGVVPLLLLGAVIAYRALGHAISGRYVVLRSGLVSRRTTTLQRSAVSTIALRQSLLQRRLGLMTVSTMTAAGWGGYDAPDLDAREAPDFANRASAGLLEPFLVRSGDSTGPAEAGPTSR